MARKKLAKRYRPPQKTDRYKPHNAKDWLTISELSEETGRDVSWLRRLEREGRIPKANRVQVGQLSVRLWPPYRVQEIKDILNGLHPGRPRGS